MAASHGAGPSAGEFLVELKGVVKRFPEVLAVDSVDFQLKKGEVHALLGENGAGKTTLMNVLYGLVKPDLGEIWIRGSPCTIRSPKDAIAQGIGMVHQNLKVVEPHTVLENIILGLKEPRFLLKLNDASKRVRQISERYGLEVDPGSRIWQLSVGERQRVEILKVLYRNAEILIMDEPTSVLTPQETVELFRSLRRMAEEGKGIIYITHKLREVFELSDRVTVMRKGRVVATMATEDAEDHLLARLMVGRDVVFEMARSSSKAGDEMLTLREVSALNDKGLPALRSVTLSVRRGEIVGVAGVAGNGQRELAEVIAGLRKPTEGRIFIEGRDVTGASPRAIFERGLAFIPEERMGVGTVPTLSVAENLAMKNYRYPPYSRRGVLDAGVVLGRAEELIRRFDIAAPSPSTPSRFLSGGNIQKVVLARELSGVVSSQPPKVLVAAYATRGLDVGATEYVQRTLLRYRDDGCAILLISEDLDELMMLSDRLAVIFEGRIMGCLSPDQFVVEDIGLMMAGREPGAAGGRR
jgi:simple sugar transport system ATP-binding protein